MNQPLTPYEPTQLDSLLYQWSSLKAAEQDAAEQRHALESRILEITGVKDEGSETIDTPFYKLTVTGKMNRTIDVVALPAVRKAIPLPIFERVFPHKPKLDVRELRYVMDHEPELYVTIAEAITVRPGKPYLKVEGVTG